MGTKLGELTVSEEVSLSDFKGKIMLVDTMNLLYQFVSSIRQQDGTPLKDSRGNITSHLTGLFSRTTKLMKEGLKLAFVFDGKAPDLKSKERERRQTLKDKAELDYKEAVDTEDISLMKKFASRTTKVTTEMVEEAKELVIALGLPVINAPSEGEAQASYMVSKGEGDYVVSQDMDCLIFGASKMVKNLSIANKRKKINAVTYKKILPEVITLQRTLNELQITQDQLICLSMLVGTDFNYGGIKGLGPKKALKLVKEHGENKEELFKSALWNENIDVPWQEIFDLIKNMPVTDNYNLEWKGINEENIIELLVERHDFSKDNVLRTIKELDKEMNKAEQKGLGDFF